MKQVYVSNNVGDPLEHDYDLEYIQDKTLCLYSRNSEWADYLHGQKAGLIKNVEDGYVIKIGTQKMRLDFADIQVLKILLLSDLKDTDYFEIRESTTIKTWLQIEDTEIEESLR